MTQAMETASRYIETWNANDANERDRLLASHWTTEASYVDPLMSAANATELSGLIAGVHQRFPGFRFTLINTPDGHGKHVRFAWGLGPAGAEPVIEGSDVITLEDGRMKDVVGFLDKVPVA